MDALLIFCAPQEYFTKELTKTEKNTSHEKCNKTGRYVREIRFRSNEATHVAQI